MAQRPTPTFLAGLASWLALPVYVWQGLGVRRRTHRMAPPVHRGRLAFPGEGEPLRLLVIGDSSAAGVGVDRIEDSFAGLWPEILAERTRRPVMVRIAGMNSATSGQIRDYVLPHIEERDFDYVALNIGVNDAKNLHGVRRFQRDFGTLLYALKSRFPGAMPIWSGILDLEDVPALPFPLSRILGIRSRMLDAAGRRLCRERGALCPPPEWRPLPANFSQDGFHASHQGYREWAEGLAAYVIALEDGRDRADPPQAIASFVG